MLVLTFGTASIGIIAFLISPARGSKQPVPPFTVAILAILIIAVMLGSIYVAGLPIPQAQLPPRVPESRASSAPINICAGNGGGANCLGPGVVSYSCSDFRSIGGGAESTYVTLNQRFCGQGPETAHRNVRHNFSGPGGECGWTSFTIICQQ
jgi:hypothetical protein